MVKQMQSVDCRTAVSFQMFEESSYPFMGTTLRATLSVGVASYPQHGKTILELIHAADRAMYQAKAAGKNRVCLA